MHVEEQLVGGALGLGKYAVGLYGPGVSFVPPRPGMRRAAASSAGVTPVPATPPRDPGPLQDPGIGAPAVQPLGCAPTSRPATIRAGSRITVVTAAAISSGPRPPPRLGGDVTVTRARSMTAERTSRAAAGAATGYASVRSR